jgi:hypothetical protein
VSSANSSGSVDCRPYKAKSWLSQQLRPKISIAQIRAAICLPERQLLLSSVISCYNRTTHFGNSGFLRSFPTSANLPRSPCGYNLAQYLTRSTLSNEILLYIIWHIIHILTCPSQDTHDRAQRVSIETLPTDISFVTESDYILSIVPPRDALATAKRITTALFVHFPFSSSILLFRVLPEYPSLIRRQARHTHINAATLKPPPNQHHSIT